MNGAAWTKDPCANKTQTKQTITQSNKMYLKVFLNFPIQFIWWLPIHVPSRPQVLPWGQNCTVWPLSCPPHPWYSLAWRLENREVALLGARCVVLCGVDQCGYKVDIPHTFSLISKLSDLDAGIVGLTWFQSVQQADDLLTIPHARTVLPYRTSLYSPIFEGRTERVWEA